MNCPDCKHPLNYSRIMEYYWCMFCQELPIKNWKLVDGKLVVLPREPVVE